MGKEKDLWIWACNRIYNRSESNLAGLYQNEQTLSRMGKGFLKIIGQDSKGYIPILHGILEEDKESGGVEGEKSFLQVQSTSRYSILKTFQSEAPVLLWAFSPHLR